MGCVRGGGAITQAAGCAIDHVPAAAAAARNLSARALDTRTAARAQERHIRARKALPWPELVVALAVGRVSYGYCFGDRGGGGSAEVLRPACSLLHFLYCTRIRGPARFLNRRAVLRAFGRTHKGSCAVFEPARSVITGLR